MSNGIVTYGSQDLVLPPSGPGSPRKLELPDPEDDGLKILPNIRRIYHSEER